MGKDMRCPVCNAESLVTEIGGLIDQFLCKKCNYRGEFNLEEDMREDTALV